MFIRSLCGVIDLDDVAEDRFKSEKEYWTKDKTLRLSIEKLMSSPLESVEEWELRMAQALNGIKDAKSVTVTFEFNGKNITSKINYCRLRNILLEKSDIDFYDFVTEKEGKKVISDQLIKVKP